MTFLCGNMKPSSNKMGLTITSATTTKPESVAFNYATIGFTHRQANVKPFGDWIVAGAKVNVGVLPANGGNVINASRIVSKRFDVQANWAIPFDWPIIATVVAWNVVDDEKVDITTISAKISPGSFEILP